MAFLSLRPVASPHSLLFSPITRGAAFIGGFAMVVFFVTRLVLLLTLARENVSWDTSLAGAMLVGLGFDLLAAFYVGGVWILLASLLASPGLGWWRLVPLAVVLFAIWYFLRAQGWVAMGAVMVVLGISTLCVLGKLSGKIYTVTIIHVFIAVLLFGAVSEWFFWQEFGVRFNFIAVDYLIYTQEVIANFNESYPMPVILSCIGIATLAVGYVFRRWIGLVNTSPIDWKRRLAALGSAMVLVVSSFFLFGQSQLPKFENNYNAELAKNGLYSFGHALRTNQIDYETFYLTRDLGVTLQRCQKQLATTAASIASGVPGDMRRKIQPQGEEKKWNVILVCVEGLSGEYLGALGNKRGLTPNLDRMSEEGIFFKNLYATGTRTVRGMEALTLCIPPTPGASIVRREDCADMFSIGALFAERGYDNVFLYGGNGLFDNMNYFFTHNGYRVVDRTKKSGADVTFENAWGACDGDMLRWTLEEAGRAHAAGKPFHHFCMTTSNHRPFTFPRGVDLKDSAGVELTDGPKRTVKYTDFAINEFIASARSKPWFDSTLFVIVADHCAFSAGKADLDVSKFHIPALIWNPKLVSASKIVPLCSQIDLMPTVFGLMKWNYTSRFFGQDVFDPDFTKERRRAFISNSQKVALLTDSQLAILKPKSEFSLYNVNRREGTLSHNDALTPLLEEAVAYYQSAAFLYGSGRLRSGVAAP